MTVTEFFSYVKEQYLNKILLSSYQEFDVQDALDYISDVIAIPYDKFLEHIKNDLNYITVLSSDVPQFSSLDSATYKICEILGSRQEQGYTFEEIGQMLLPERSADTVANKKYGENHVKTATDLGLCFYYKGRYYISAIGRVFSQLNLYQKDQLLSRLTLRNHLVYSVVHHALNGLNVDVASEISFLAESTVKRRKNNCLILIRLMDHNKDMNVDHILSKIR